MHTQDHAFGGTVTRWGVATEVAVIYLLSTVPTPLYELYRQVFHFSEITLTLVYAAYVVGTVTIMFFLGRLADQIGRRPVVLVSLVVAAVGAVVFLLANAAAWLFPARILSGLAIALASGASTAWITELQPGHDSAGATQLVITANLVGLGFGGLLGGFLAQWSAGPLRVPYLVFLGLLFPVALWIWRSKETIEKPKSLAAASVRPRLGVPRELRSRFVSPALGAFAIFSVMGFYSALIPGMLSRSLHRPNHALAGLVVAELFILGAMAVALVRRADNRKGLILSLSLLLPSIGLLVAAEAVHSLWILLAGTALSGVATGLGYRFSLQDLTELAPEDKRSEMVSMYLIACYGGVSLPVIGVGLLEKLAGPFVAHLVFGAVIAVLALAVLLFQSVSFSSGPLSKVVYGVK